MELLQAESVLSLFSNPHDLIRIGGLLLLLVIIYLETGFFLGLVLPGGDYLVFTAGLLAGTHYLEIPLHVLVPAMAGAAILGDYTGYAKGKWLGNRLFDKEENRIFKRSYLEKSKRFYEKYGVGAFIIGRFLPVVRTMGPMLAGASRIKLLRFSFYNVAGAFIWIGSLAPAGYYLGNKYPQIMQFTHFFFIGFVVIVSTPLIISYLKLRRNKVGR
jgi:membrane-associated protein